VDRFTTRTQPSSRDKELKTSLGNCAQTETRENKRWRKKKGSSKIREREARPLGDEEAVAFLVRGNLNRLIGGLREILRGEKAH